MNPLAIGALVFTCTFAGALGGMWLCAALPDQHLGDQSKDTVKLGIGLVATMTALLLGLVTASAKSSFDGLDTAVKFAAADVLTLDRTLSRYGPETKGVREALHRAIEHRLELTWPKEVSRAVQLQTADMTRSTEGVVDAIRGLSPQSDSQRQLQARALELGESLLKARWIVFSGAGTSVPVPFLVVLIFWLTIIFASFGLFAPRNATVISVLLVCALSVAGAVFLILEMQGPFEGLISVSADPLRYALAHMNR